MAAACTTRLYLIVPINYLYDSSSQYLVRLAISYTTRLANILYD